jgi:hypothetical protein
MNGLDNDVGARWKFKYRSMNNPLITDPNIACGGSAMTNWGQETDYGTVTLGTPDNYIPKNAPAPISTVPATTIPECLDR